MLKRAMCTESGHMSEVPQNHREMFVHCFITTHKAGADTHRGFSSRPGKNSSQPGCNIAKA
jgi:hypothetical protein